VKEACVDANILVSLLSADEITDENKGFLRQILNQPSLLWVPALASFEVSHVLAKKASLQNLTHAQAQTGQRLFFKLPLVFLWNEELMAKALEIQQTGIPTLYDAAYLATAILKNVPLITHDLELVKKGKKIWPAIFSLQEWMK